MFTFSTTDGNNNRNSISLTSGKERLRDINRNINGKGKTDRVSMRDQIFS